MTRKRRTEIHSSSSNITREEYTSLRIFEGFSSGISLTLTLPRVDFENLLSVCLKTSSFEESTSETSRSSGREEDHGLRFGSVSLDLVFEDRKSRREEVVERRRGDEVLRNVFVGVLFLRRNGRDESVVRKKGEGSDLVN